MAPHPPPTSLPRGLAHGIPIGLFIWLLIFAAALWALWP